MTAIRSGARVRVTQFANIRVGDLAEAALCVDISFTGLRLVRLLGPAELPHDTIGLEFQLPGDEHTIWATGRIARRAWNGSTWASVGVELQSLHPEDGERIRQFVRKQRRWEREQRGKRVRNLTRICHAQECLPDRVQAPLGV